jgi:hypothetical protein
MQRTDFRASKRQRPENIAAQCAARVQDDFPAPSLAACDSGESFRCFGDGAIRCGDQNQIGRQHGL